MKNEKRSPGENKKKKTNLEKQENNQSKKTLRKVKNCNKNIKPGHWQNRGKTQRTKTYGHL